MTPKQLIAPAIIAIATVAFLAFYLPGIRSERTSEVNTVSGAVAIGGAFAMVDQAGRPVTSETLKGKHLLVYFGFTHCPDICPFSLQTMTQAMEILGPIGEGVTPVFFTVDAERDTPPVMADYVANFHPRFVALTGTVEQVRAAADAYRVYFQKAKEEVPGEYMMEHSGFIYFMDRAGAYVTHFRADTTAEQMAARVRQELGPKR
jgi:protein SCO1/2